MKYRFKWQVLKNGGKIWNTAFITNSKIAVKFKIKIVQQIKKMAVKFEILSHAFWARSSKIKA